MGLDPSDIEAWARLIRVSQTVLRSVEADLKVAGFPPLIWYDALLELRRAGEKGLRPHELEQEMLLAQYNLSRLIGRLVKSDYVHRRPFAGDRRGHILVISRKGRDLLKRMWPAYREAIKAHFADRIEQGDAQRLHAILGKLGSPKDSV